MSPLQIVNFEVKICLMSTIHWWLWNKTLSSLSSTSKLLLPVFWQKLFLIILVTFARQTADEPAKLHQILFCIVAGLGNEKQLGSEKLFWHVPFSGLENLTVAVASYRA